MLKKNHIKEKLPQNKSSFHGGKTLVLMIYILTALGGLYKAHLKSQDETKH